MILEMKNVFAGYGSANALHGVNLHVAEGETVALVGANGAGKSTLLKTISGLIRTRSGIVNFSGDALADIPSPQRVVRGIAHVPEGREVFGSLSVLENIMLGSYAVRNTVDQRELGSRLEGVLVTFPALRGRLSNSAAELSGGQQQMLAIARGLMPKPKLLLLDEPSLGLAPALVDDIFRIIRDLRKLGVSVLIAEQNARMTLAIADRGYVLENGRIVAEGTGQQLLNAPDIVERYLGIGSGGGDIRRDPKAGIMIERLAAILDASSAR